MSVKSKNPKKNETVIDTTLFPKKFDLLTRKSKIERKEMAGKIFKVRFKESSILSVNYGQSAQQFSESSSVRFLFFDLAIEQTIDDTSNRYI